MKTTLKRRENRIIRACAYAFAMTLLVAFCVAYHGSAYAASADGEFTIMQYNVKGQVSAINEKLGRFNDEGCSRASERVDLQISMIKSRQPDIICTNEETSTFREEYSALSGYDNFGKNISNYNYLAGIGGDTYVDCRNGLYVRLDKFDVIAYETIWFKTSGSLTTMGETSCGHYRGATCVLLKDKNTGRYIKVASTHLCLSGCGTRAEQAGILAGYLDGWKTSYSDAQTIIVGDTNAGANAHDPFRSSADWLTWADYYLLNLRQNSSTDRTTYHRWGELTNKAAIDHQYVKQQNKTVDLKSWVILNNEKWSKGTKASDHYPILCTYKFIKYNVSFNTNGGSAAPANQSVLKGKTASKPSDPTRSGYIFGGWYTNSSCTGSAYNFSSSVNEDLTLYAKWTEDALAKAKNAAISELNGINTNVYTGGDRTYVQNIINTAKTNINSATSVSTVNSILSTAKNNINRLAATGHDWGEWTVTKTAGCTETGTRKRTCKNDSSHVETETIAATGHDWGGWSVTKAATCTQTGTKTRTCSHDSTHKETATIAATGHDWGGWSVTKAATCTQSGTKTRTCSHDSTHKETETIAATDHDWGGWSVTKAATCTQTGTKVRVCTYDATHKETETIAATDHDWRAWNVTKAATCTQPGTRTRTCSHDSTHRETETIAATDHDWGAWNVTKAATCTQSGTRTRTCSHDSTHSETETITATGHDWGAWNVTKAATCTQAGTKMRTCSHDPTHKETEAIEATGHDWSQWQKTKDATCTEDGALTRTCNHDSDHKETQIIEAIGHDWSKWQKTKDATCTGDGTLTRTCSHDSAHKETQKIEATGHDWSQWQKTKDATCTEDGAMIRTCSHDSAHKETQKIEATGHDWSQWRLTKTPTCTTAGTETRTCSNNKTHYETRKLDAVGHTWKYVGFSWMEDEAGYRAYARYICEKDERHTEQVEGHVGSRITDPTCEQPGEIRYSARIDRSDSLDDKAHTDPEGPSEIKPAKGHYWVFDGFTQLEDPESHDDEVVASYHCARDGSHKKVTPAEESNNDTPPTSIEEDENEVKKANTLTLKGKKVTIKSKKLKKKKRSLARGKVLTVTGAQGTVTYSRSTVVYTKAKSVKMSKKALKKYRKKAGRKIAVNSRTGRVTVGKGLKKGTYNVRVHVTAAGNDDYHKATKTVTFTLKIK